MSLAKPRFSEPCNGCGLCCAQQVCEVGEKFMPGAQAPCPALEWEDGRAWCGLIRHPSRHLLIPFNGDEIMSPLFSKVIGINQGCGMEDEEPNRVTAPAFQREMGE